METLRKLSTPILIPDPHAHLGVLGVSKNGESSNAVPDHRVAVTDESSEEIQVRLLEDLSGLVAERLSKVVAERKLRLFLSSSKSNSLGTANPELSESDQSYQHSLKQDYDCHEIGRLRCLGFDDQDGYGTWCELERDGT